MPDTPLVISKLKLRNIQKHNTHKLLESNTAWYITPTQTHKYDVNFRRKKCRTKEEAEDRSRTRPNGRPGLHNERGQLPSTRDKEE